MIFCVSDTWIILQMVVTVLLNIFQLLQIVSQSQLQILCCGLASLPELTFRLCKESLYTIAPFKYQYLNVFPNDLILKLLILISIER